MNGLQQFGSPRPAMDGNKDEAARCVRIAEAALASGDKQRAVKFLRIARRLDSTIPIEALQAARDSLSNHTREEQVQSDRAREKPTSSNTSEPSIGDGSYTEDHVKLIREIKRHKDYYAILGVEKSCSVEEIRKAYRKLSLKVHPDKNKAPGAEEAFKAVSKAFKCLSDEQSRLQYDQTGLIDQYELQQQQNHVRRRGRRAARNDFFDENFDPDEIFRSFFYGAQGDVFGTHRVPRTRGPAAQQREQNVQGGGFNFIMWVQVLVILLFLLFAYLPFSELQYSLQKTYTYRTSRITEKHGVEYFVRSEEFDQKYPEGSPARENLENNVLRDYKSILARYCHIEMQRRQWVRNYPTPHCDKLRSLGAT